MINFYKGKLDAIRGLQPQSRNADYCKGYAEVMNKLEVLSTLGDSYL